MTPDAEHGDTDKIKDATLAVVEEVATVGRRVVKTGRVRIVTRTETVSEIVGAALETVAAKVTRVPVDRYLDPGAPPPQTRTEGAVTIVPVIEEVLVVETRLLLREEVHIDLQKSVEDVAIPISLRRQKADVERLAEPLAPNRDPPT